ncbi:MAG: hypothetical protein C3F17_02380 [Bradyrhizobiaceae bacterium]|nr:MAG: hypothetical protein C3F17_02380 [Bradyrhizobiaceae bacterium]
MDLHDLRDARSQAASRGLGSPSAIEEAAAAHELLLSVPVEHLLVATDFSPGGRRAVARALERGKALGAQVTLLHVVEEALPRGLARQRREEALWRLAEQARSLGRGATHDVSFNVRAGEPGLEILREAIELGSDAIVLGLGDRCAHLEAPASTVMDVVRCGDRPVLMVAGPPSTPYRRAVVHADPLADIASTERAARRLAPQVETHLVPSPAAVAAGMLSAARVAPRVGAAVLLDCVRRVGADLLVVDADGLQHDDHDPRLLLRHVGKSALCDLLLARDR